MSFRLKTILGIALIETVLLFILVLSGINFLSESNEEQLKQRAEITSRLFADATKDAVLATDLATLEIFVEDILDNPEVVYISIKDANRRVLAKGGDALVRSVERTTDHSLSDVDDGVFDTVTYIEESGIRFGSIHMGLSTSSIEVMLANAQRWAISIASLEIVLVAIFSFVLGTYLTRQLARLKQGSEIIEQTGPGHQIEISSHDELAEVAKSFNLMSRSLESNYQKIEEALASQKQSLADARRNEAKNKAILSSSLDALITINADGLIIDFNQVAEETFGWSYTEVANQPMGDFIIPHAMRQAHHNGMAHYLATGEGPVLGQRLELTALRKSGEEFPVEIAISPIETDEGPMFTAFIRDISDRLATETELRLAARAFETSEAMFITDSEVQVIRANSAFTDITGYSESEVIGKKPGSFLKSGLQNKAFYQEMWQEIKTTGSWSGEIYNKRKNGEIFPEYLSISTVKDADGETSHYVAHFVDISEQKNNEKRLEQARHDAEAANLAKSRFLAAMSHEIRTPMNAVLGIFDLLKDTDLSDQQIQLIDTGHESGKLLLGIINNILDFSKMEAGKFELDNEAFDLKELIQRTVDLLKVQADAKPLALQLKLDGSLPHYVTGDPLRLRQILLNLLNNAIKFTDQGRVEIRAQEISSDEHRSELQFDIIDTGIGITPEFTQTLFDEFTMADETHSRAYEGTGLGLAICKQLVQLMDGDIQVSSELGKGSTFSFKIKLLKANANERLNRHKQTSSQNTLEGTHILLAEDNAANQMIIGKILEHAGVKVDMVNNGQEAIDAVQLKPYDLILMDISMPDKDGIAATQEIRALAKPYCEIPVIALTAHALTGDRQRFLAAGMNDYQTKPINREALLQTISYWAGGVHQEKSTQAKSGNADTDEELVDEKVLAQLVKDTSADIVPELLNFYIDDAHKLIEKIKQATDAKNIESLEFASHTLGSSAGAHSNMLLHKLAREIEHHCQAHQEQQALELVEPMLTTAEESFKLLAQRAQQGFNLKS